MVLLLLFSFHVQLNPWAPRNSVLVVQEKCYFVHFVHLQIYSKKQSCSSCNESWNSGVLEAQVEWPLNRTGMFAMVTIANDDEEFKSRTTVRIRAVDRKSSTKCPQRSQREGDYCRRLTFKPIHRQVFLLRPGRRWPEGRGRARAPLRLGMHQLVSNNHQLNAEHYTT